MTEPSSTNLLKSVLLIRANTLQDLWATDGTIAFLRQRFPDRPLLTLVTGQSDTAALLQSDTRFDQVLIYNPADGIPAYYKLLAEANVGTIVVSVHLNHQLDYSRQISSTFFFPGGRYLIGDGNQLVNFVNPAAWPTIASAFGKLLLHPFRAAGSRLARKVGQLMLTRARGRHLTERQKSCVRSILWIRLDHIGDFVMSVPAINALRKDFPNARVDILTQGTNFPMVDSIVGIDHVLRYNAPRYYSKNFAPTTRRDFIRLIFSLRKAKYDLVFDSRGDDEARKIAFLARSTYRLGLYPGPMWSDEISAWALTLTHPVALESPSHTTENCLALVDRVGLDATFDKCPLKVSEESDKDTRRFLSELKLDSAFAVVHPCSRDPIKNWAPERMAAVIDHLVNSAGLDVLLTGGPDDREDVELIRNRVKSSGKVHNVAGRISLKQLPALLSKARIVLGVDTGPMHIAAAFGTPVIALFIQRHSKLFYPYGQRKNIIIAEEQPDCGFANDAKGFDKYSLLPLQSISVDTVIAKIDSLLAETEA